MISVKPSHDSGALLGHSEKLKPGQGQGPSLVKTSKLESAAECARSNVSDGRFIILTSHWPWRGGFILTPQFTEKQNRFGDACQGHTWPSRVSKMHTPKPSSALSRCPCQSQELIGSVGMPWVPPVRGLLLFQSWIICAPGLWSSCRGWWGGGWCPPATLHN